MGRRRIRRRWMATFRIKGFRSRVQPEQMGQVGGHAGEPERGCLFFSHLPDARVERQIAANGFLTCWFRSSAHERHLPA